MNIFEALTSLLSTVSKDVRTGYGKSYEDFAEQNTSSNRAFYISWDGKTVTDKYVNGGVANYKDNVMLYFKTPKNYLLGSVVSATIEQIDNVLDVLENDSTFFDDSSQLRYISVNSVMPIVDDLNDVIGINLSID